MGTSNSRPSTTKKASKPPSIPPLPPLPEEVVDHCTNNGCELKRHTLTLNITGDLTNGDNVGRVQEREYIIHLPTNALSTEHINSSTERVPLVICIHGTDETIHDTELLVHEAVSGNNLSQTTWLDLSHHEAFMLVFPQSLRYCAVDDVPMSWRPIGDNLRSCWEPGNNDELFMSCLLDKLLVDYPFIDSSRVYCVGYSNGGLFLSALLLNHGFDKRLTAVCNYMGGLCPKQMTDDAHLIVEEAAEWVERPCISLLGVSSTNDHQHSVHSGYPCSNKGSSLSNVFKNQVPCDSLTGKVIEEQTTPPIYIVTGSCDGNRNYCYNALCGFKQLNYEVYFDDLKEIHHEYQNGSTIDIWTFFKTYKRKSLSHIGVR